MFIWTTYSLAYRTGYVFPPLLRDDNHLDRNIEVGP